MSATLSTYEPRISELAMPNDMPLCQTDYPLDHYQTEFVPYAEEYLALPDRKIETVLKWMTPYMQKARDHFGEQLLLLAHYYMGGEIVQIIEHFGGQIGDSYQLALMAARQPEKSVIVESAVHFMAESISLLAHEHQRVYITNPKSGCTMEMMAKDYMVEPALTDLNERYGKENILPVCYMNTSGRIKAMTGAQGGAVCTSSNVKKICEWAFSQNKKVLFIPDRYMGENVAYWLNIPAEEIAYWPGGTAGAQYQLAKQDAKTLAQFDRSKLILFSSFCAVHTYYEPYMVEYWKKQGFTTIVHPECMNSVVRLADQAGSTAFIWDYIAQNESPTGKYAVGTENHMVDNLKRYAATQTSSGQPVQVVNLAEAPLPEGKKTMGCGCATMSRNDPPHLVALLDLLRQGKNVDYNLIKPGDIVDEFSGKRIRLNEEKQEWIRVNAKKSLEKMIEITEAGK
jgi:quinolinate synthase